MKAYTDIEQSKKLAEILPLESADMRYGYIAPYDYSDRMYDGGYDEIPYPKDFLIKNPNFSANEYDAELPCWSLSALLEILSMPTLIQDKADDELFWQCSVYDEEGEEICEVYASDKVDACYKMVLELHKLKKL